MNSNGEVSHFGLLETQLRITANERDSLQAGKRLVEVERDMLAAELAALRHVLADANAACDGCPLRRRYNQRCPVWDVPGARAKEG